MHRIGTWRATTNLPIRLIGALLWAVVLTFALVTPAHAVEIYDEGTYGSGYYSAADDAEGGGDTGGEDPDSEPGGDIPSGSEVPGTTPGTPNTEALDESGRVQIGPVAVDWSSLWIGLAVILSLTTVVGVWTLHKQRR